VSLSLYVRTFSNIFLLENEETAANRPPQHACHHVSGARRAFLCFTSSEAASVAAQCINMIPALFKCRRSPCAEMFDCNDYNGSAENIHSYCTLQRCSIVVNSTHIHSYCTSYRTRQFSMISHAAFSPPGAFQNVYCGIAVL
jgi:hypothetical protein